MQSAELLFRQIHPNWLVDDGVPGSLSFEPSRHDEDCLSVDRGACTNAAGSYSFFTSDRPAGLGQKSIGVWAPTVEEVDKVGCKAFSEPEPAGAETPANAAHAVIDFEGISGNQQKKIGARLKIFAVTRGRLAP